MGLGRPIELREIWAPRISLQHVEVGNKKITNLKELKILNTYEWYLMKRTITKHSYKTVYKILTKRTL
jgi:hypothetical protein